MKFFISSAALVVVGFFFMDDAASKQNRLDVRYNNTQLVDLIAFYGHMASPMPWE